MKTKRVRWTKYGGEPAAEFRVNFCLTVGEIALAIAVDTCDTPAEARRITTRKGILQAVRESLTNYGYTFHGCKMDERAEESVEMAEDPMPYEEHFAVIRANVEAAFPELVRVETAKAV
jgi:hypothetical protein